MIRYVLALLLTNTFYCSFGYPINENYATLGKSLQLLAGHCGNVFLSSQITSKIDPCNISMSAEREIIETELECLIFYDINSQLCTAFRGSSSDLSQSYSLRINNALKVETTCNTSKNWKITHLTEYPKYYNTSERVFKTKVTCLKACGVDDLLSEDTNFFCKYYHWGSELLQTLVTSTQQTSNVGNSEIRPPLVESFSKAPESSALPTSINNGNSPKAPSANEHLQEEQVQLEPPKQQLKNETKNTNVSPSSNQIENQNVNGMKLELPEHQPAPVPDVSTSTKNEIDKSRLAHDGAHKKKTDKDPIKADEIPSADPDDDENFDPEDDGLPDSPQGIDGNDPALESDTKANGEKKTPKKNMQPPIVSSLNVEMSQRAFPEFYSNTMQDAFAEDDDHFFSFFLTAIILVILLYVLYHNKNKFRKLCLGLLVEGRQPGRRRNSRGHEYRRLDTLEQAMNTNSAAPPSKIIY